MNITEIIHLKSFIQFYIQIFTNTLVYPKTATLLTGMLFQTYTPEKQRLSLNIP